MQFTPQQMAGAQRYGSQTRIGNWYEDERLAEARFSSFTEKKERKLLASYNRRQKMGICLQKVPLSFCEENGVRFGSSIQLESAEVGGSLACDPFEEMSLGSQLYLATVCPSPAQSLPAARLAFRLVAVTEPRLQDKKVQAKKLTEEGGSLLDAEGQPVRYGDLFHLMCDPGLRVCETSNMRKPSLYLASALKTENLSSRVSNKQATFLKSGATSSTVWQFQKTTYGKDGSLDRMSSVGSPVPVDTQVVIQHRDTLMALSCEKGCIEPTDFGAEYEVCCHNMTTNGKSLQLVAELKGSKTAGSAAKAELQTNRWLVRQGQHETAEAENDESGGREGRTRELPPEMTATNILNRVKGVVQGRTAGIQCLRNALCSIDPAGNGKLDREDVRWCLHDFGVSMDDEQSAILFDKFDTNNASGLVEVEEFLSGLTEPLSENRKTVLEEKFRSFSLDGQGKVSLKQLQESFDAEAAVCALNGNNATAPITTLEALRSGLAARGSSRSGNINFDQFQRYHQDLCIDVGDDDLFDGVLKAAWRAGDARI